MELPFKYIVLCIIKTLAERNMPLVIDRSDLIDYFKEIMKKSYFTTEEKCEIGENFDFDYELNELFTKYFQYFDNDGQKIIFDENYINELGSLILDETNEFDQQFINDIDFVIEGDTDFLDIIGVEIKKELYNYLLDIEKDIENCYNEMSDLDNYVGLDNVDINPLMSKMKKLHMKKKIMILNANNLLLPIQYNDLVTYASNMTDNGDDLCELSLLIDDEQFNDSDIMYDTFLMSIFTGSDLYLSNLRDSLIINDSEMDRNEFFSKINFYLTFLKLLEKEIKNSNELLNMELIKIKYRIMNVMDSVYGTALFIGKETNDHKNFKENYDFVCDAVYYFIREILMYDNDKYRNKDCDTENTMIYLNNIIKKLLVETYYELTKDKYIVNMIKENELYGINTISSSFLKDIVDKPRSKIKGI